MFPATRLSEYQNKNLDKNNKITNKAKDLQYLLKNNKTTNKVYFF